MHGHAAYPSSTTASSTSSSSSSTTSMLPHLARPSSLALFPTPAVPQHSSTSFIGTITPTSYSILNTPTSVTTPIVITPNTLKTIEQSILQTLGEDTSDQSFLMESQQCSGNFVPPLPSSTSTITLINTWQGGQVSSESGINGEEEQLKGRPRDHDMEHQHNSTSDNPHQFIVGGKVHNPVTQQASQNKKQGGPKRKRTPNNTTTPPQHDAPRSSNSKPNKAAGKRTTPKSKKPVTAKGTKSSSQPPEEDERRRVRRERNKLAAARCRKRRVDHTNKLVEETEGLEAKKRALQDQITELQAQREELEFILDAHNCVKKVIKNEVLSDLQNLPSIMKQDSSHVSVLSGAPSTTISQLTSVSVKLKRPNTLNVVTAPSSTSPTAQVTVSMCSTTTTTPSLIPINTPSNGIAGLGFEPLCPDWGVSTPTPTQPPPPDHLIVPDRSCLGDAQQAKHHQSTTPSLVTPVTNPYKKLHDL